MFQTLDQLCPATLSATSRLRLDGDEHCAKGCKALSKESNDHCYPGTPVCADEGSHTWAHNQLWGGHGDHYKGNCFTLGVTSIGPWLPQEESRGLWNVMNRDTHGYNDYRWGTDRKVIKTFCLGHLTGITKVAVSSKKASNKTKVLTLTTSLPTPLVAMTLVHVPKLIVYLDVTCSSLGNRAIS